MKTKQILLTGGILAAVIGGGVYFTQYYPEQAEIWQLEKQLKNNKAWISLAEKSAEKKIAPERLRILAEKGYAVAQYWLAKFYEKNENNALAEKWYWKAAEQKMGEAYLALFHLKKDDQKKTEYLEKAVELGSLEAKMWAAFLAIRKNKDNLTGFMLLEQAAKAEYFTALSMMGDFYFYGLGDKPDWEKAFYWYNKAYLKAKSLNIAAIGVFPLNDQDSHQDIYQQLAKLYLLGIGNDENKAEQLLNERSKVREQNTIAELLYLKEELSLDDLKLKILEMDIPKQYEDRVAILKAEMTANQSPEMLIKLGEKAQDQSKAKFYFGEACDKGSQVGCDKYREMNEKGVK